MFHRLLLDRKQSSVLQADVCTVIKQKLTVLTVTSICHTFISLLRCPALRKL
jgi:hypothetical protein